MPYCQYVHQKIMWHRDIIVDIKIIIFNCPELARAKTMVKYYLNLIFTGLNIKEKRYQFTTTVKNSSCILDVKHEGSQRSLEGQFPEKVRSGDPSKKPRC